MQDSKLSTFKEFQIRKSIIRSKGIYVLDKLAMRQANIFQQTKEQLKKKYTDSVPKNVKNFSIFKQPQQKESKQFFLTDQYIKNSKIYKMLEEQIRAIQLKHQEEISKLLSTEKNKDKEIQQIHKDTHQSKIQIWEIKNQIMEIQNQITYEEQEFQYYMGQTEQNLEQYKENGDEQQQQEMRQIESEEFVQVEIPSPEKQQVLVPSSQLLSFRADYENNQME